MKQISILIKPASSLCNMACRYCFYRDEADLREKANHGIMNNETMETLIKKTLAMDVVQVNYCFQGGEPTVAGINYFESFIQCVNQHKNSKKISYSIQTNGLLLNEKWYDLFSQHHFLVGISLDGTELINDSLRVDLKGQGTFNKIMHAIKELESRNIEYNVLTVLSHDLAKYPKELYEFYKKNQIQYIQFIPCLPSLEGSHPYALTPQDFSSFYKQYFDEWYKDYQQGFIQSVTLFEQLISMYLGFLPSLCGMLNRCHMQFVVEASGDVYPCDFYALDQYHCGNVLTHSMADIFQHQNAKRFVNEKNATSQLCLKCSFYKMCYGYCKRMDVCLRDEKICGYQDFLAYSKDRFFLIAQHIRKRGF